MTHAKPNEPAAPGSPPSTSFADLLRRETSAVHREAERSGILSDLLHGRSTRTAYALYLHNLVPVYASLEATLLAARAEPLLAVFTDLGRRRRAMLVSDLAAITGVDKAWPYPLLPQAEDYAARISSAHDDMPRLVAHAYARYLGDLNGGQILKSLLARTLKLAPEALSFYDFPLHGDLGALKTSIRRALDAIPTSDPAASAIVAEAIVAFRHNVVLSQAVQAAADDIGKAVKSGRIQV